ncbi:hypothetical protein ACH4CE_16920 [Streptomyces gelaticus]
MGGRVARPPVEESEERFVGGGAAHIDRYDKDEYVTPRGRRAQRLLR